MDYAPEVFSIDHVIPQSRGGESTLDNLALSCQACNNHKYTRVTWVDPVSGEMAPLYNPRQQIWKDHFTWSKDFTLIVGRTPTGWATIEALDMNRQSVVNLRRVLHNVGEHPPDEPER